MDGLEEFGIGRSGATLLCRPGTRIIYVVGDVDTGKTTLAGRITALSARVRRTAEVDLDAGQATIGPPTTFGWRLAGWRGRPAGMYFTGATSPVGYFELWVAGAVVMVSEAITRAERVVVDTCGLARGVLGCQLHHPVMEAVRPDVVVALEREDELAELLCPLERARRPAVLRVRPPDAVRRRSWARRRIYRRARFERYFAKAREMELRLDDISLVRWKADPDGRIASLRGLDGRDVALGIVQRCGVPSGTLTVLTPFRFSRRVSAVVLGSVRIARDGRQLARDG